MLPSFRKKDIASFFLIPLLAGLIFFCQRNQPRNLPSETFKINEWLRESLQPDAPCRSSGKNVRAGSLWNWGFTDNVQVGMLGTLSPLPIKIETNGLPVMVKGGINYPAYNILEGETDSAKSNIAYNPFRTGYPQPVVAASEPGKAAWGPINGCGIVEKAWTTGSKLSRSWYGVDFGENRLALSVVLEFYETKAPGKFRLPQQYYLEHEVNGRWQKIPGQQTYPRQPESGLNLVSFPRMIVRKIRVVMRHQAKDHSVGLIRFQVQGEARSLPQVLERKFITQNDVMVSLFTIKNPSWHFPLDVRLQIATNWAEKIENKFLKGRLNRNDTTWFFSAGCQGLEFSEIKMNEFNFHLAPREEKSLQFVLAVAPSDSAAAANLQEWLAKKRPLKKQVVAYENWFKENVPFFRCSDRELARKYFRQWILLRKNGLFSAHHAANVSLIPVKRLMQPIQQNELMNQILSPLSDSIFQTPDIQKYLSTSAEATDSTEMIQFLRREFPEPALLLSALIYTLHNQPAGSLKPVHFWQQFRQVFPVEVPPNPVSFIKAIIHGLVGFAPEQNGSQIVIHPLVPADSLEYFVLERLPFAGHELTIIWDRPGGRDYFEDNRAGLNVYLDHKLFAETPDLPRMVIDLPE